MLSVLRALLKRMPAHYVMLAAAVFFAVTAISTAQFVGKTMEYALERDRDRVGPDIILIPPHTFLDDRKANYTIPKEGFFSFRQIDGGKGNNLAGIAALTPQTYLGEITIANRNLKLVGFDSATDFVVRPWLASTARPRDFILNSSQVILGANAALVFKEKEGLARIRDKDYQIKGILDKTGTDMDNTIYFPLEEAGKISRLDDQDLVSWILIRSENPGFIKELAADLNIRFDPVRSVGRGEFIGAIGSSLGALLQEEVFFIFAVFVTIAAVLLVGTLFTINIWERTAELGVMQAIGASRAFLIRLSLLESVFISVVGGIMGALGGFFLSYQYAAAHHLPHLPWSDVLGLGLFSAAVVSGWCLLAALAPAFLVLQEEPAVSMQKGYK